MNNNIKYTYQVESPRTVQTEGRNWFVTRFTNKRIYGRGSYWDWDQNKGVWYPIDDRQATHDAFGWVSQAWYYTNLDDQAKGHKTRITAKRNTARDIAALAATALAVREEGRIVEDPFDRANLLNFPNGTFDIAEFTLREHCPTDYLTKVLSYPYDAAAQCPRFMQFLREVLVDETGNPAPELIDYAHRWVGSLLSAYNREQQMMILFGSGANGKSVLLDIITALIGRESVFSPDFNNLNEHVIAEMVGKRLCIATEAPTKALLDSSRFKALVSGDLLQARFIYRRPFMARYTGKIAWACNEFPPAYDQTEGLWRRIKVLPFNRYFRPDEQDPHLTPKLRQELSGIFNWALEGYIHYRREGLQEPALVRQKTQQYRAQSDPIATFIDETLTLDPTKHVTSKELYDLYKIWCIDNGYKPKARNRVAEEWKRIGLQEGLTYEGKKSIRVWYGATIA